MIDKQIEEMAKLIQNGEISRNRGDLDCTEFPTDIVIKVGLQRLAGAKALYNAGYRKASDVAREILALVWDAYQTTHYDAEFEERLDNIEKKYESEGDK